MNFQDKALEKERHLISKIFNFILNFYCKNIAFFFFFYIDNYYYVELSFLRQDLEKPYYNMEFILTFNWPKLGPYFFYDYMEVIPL